MVQYVRRRSRGITTFSPWAHVAAQHCFGINLVKVLWLTVVYLHLNDNKVIAAGSNNHIKMLLWMWMPILLGLNTVIVTNVLTGVFATLFRHRQPWFTDAVLACVASLKLLPVIFLTFSSSKCCHQTVMWKNKKKQKQYKTMLKWIKSVHFLGRNRKFCWKRAKTAHPATDCMTLLPLVTYVSSWLRIY